MLGGRETYRGAVTLGERATDRKEGCWGTDPGVVGPERMQNRPERRGCWGDAEPTGSRVRALKGADSQPLTCAWATTRLLLPSPWYPHSFSSIFPSSIPRCGPGASRGHELRAAGSPRHQRSRLGRSSCQPPPQLDPAARTRRRWPPEATPPTSPMAEPGNFRVRARFSSVDHGG